MRKLIDWIISLFFQRYQIIVQKENHLKFRDLDNKTIEYRSAGGLNYIIEDM